MPVRTLGKLELFQPLVEEKETVLMSNYKLVQSAKPRKGISSSERESQLAATCQQLINKCFRKGRIDYLCAICIISKIA